MRIRTIIVSASMLFAMGAVGTPNYDSKAMEADSNIITNITAPAVHRNRAEMKWRLSEPPYIGPKVPI